MADLSLDVRLLLFQCWHWAPHCTLLCGPNLTEVAQDNISTMLQHAFGFVFFIFKTKEKSEWGKAVELCTSVFHLHIQLLPCSQGHGGNIENIISHVDQKWHLQVWQLLLTLTVWIYITLSQRGNWFDQYLLTFIVFTIHKIYIDNNFILTPKPSAKHSNNNRNLAKSLCLCRKSEYK